MKMEFLELPFEAIALRFHVAAAAAWLAVAAAAVGLWRIRAVGSRSDASSSLSSPSSLVPSPETEPSRPVRADPASTQPCRIRPCAAPKERFTAYYGDDASYGDDDEEEEHVGVDGEMTAPLVGVRFGWEVNGDVRRGISDLGWYRYQDLTVINGSVVRLWDGDGELTPLTPLSRRRWRGRTGISHSF